MGFIVKLGAAPQTYTGFFVGDETQLVEGVEVSNVGEGEQFLESLEGWTREVLPAPPKSAEAKLAELSAMMATTSLETRLYFSEAGFTSKVFTALGGGDVELARYYVVEAGKDPQASLSMITAMLAVLES